MNPYVPVKRCAWLVGLVALKKPDNPCHFRKAKMKVGFPTFMLTADEPRASQEYAMKMP